SSAPSATTSITINAITTSRTACHPPFAFSGRPCPFEDPRRAMDSPCATENARRLALVRQGIAGRGARQRAFDVWFVEILGRLDGTAFVFHPSHDVLRNL